MAFEAVLDRGWELFRATGDVEGEVGPGGGISIVAMSPCMLSRSQMRQGFLNLAGCLGSPR